MAANHLLAAPPAFALPLSSDDEGENDALEVDGAYSFGQVRPSGPLRLSTPHLIQPPYDLSPVEHVRRAGAG